MNRLTECELVYLNQSQDESGNPVIREHRARVKCALMDSFSLNYYQGQERSMRASKNIVIAKPYTENRMVDDAIYRLERVSFNGVMYKVQNILLNKRSAITSILDCEEIHSE